MPLKRKECMLLWGEGVKLGEAKVLIFEGKNLN